MKYLFNEYGTWELNDSAKSEIESFYSILEKQNYLIDLKSLQLAYASLFSNFKGVRGFFLLGKAGVGKTSFSEKIAEKYFKSEIEGAESGSEGVSFYFQATPQMTEENLYYDFIPDEETKSGFKMREGVLVQALRSSKEKRTLLIIDEWDKADPSLDSSLLDYLQNARLKLANSVEIGESANLFVIIISNAVRDFSEPLWRRLPVIELPPLRYEDVEQILVANFGETNKFIAPILNLWQIVQNAKIDREVSIQEYVQLIEAMETLEDGGDWTLLVYSFIAKSFENMKLIKRSEEELVQGGITQIFSPYREFLEEYNLTLDPYTRPLEEFFIKKAEELSAQKEKEKDKGMPQFELIRKKTKDNPFIASEIETDIQYSTIIDKTLLSEHVNLDSIEVLETNKISWNGNLYHIFDDYVAVINPLDYSFVLEKDRDYNTDKYMLKLFSLKSITYGLIEIKSNLKDFNEYFKRFLIDLKNDLSYRNTELNIKISKIASGEITYYFEEMGIYININSNNNVFSVVMADNKKYRIFVNEFYNKLLSHYHNDSKKDTLRRLHSNSTIILPKPIDEGAEKRQKEEELKKKQMEAEELKKKQMEKAILDSQREIGNKIITLLKTNKDFDNKLFSFEYDFQKSSSKNELYIDIVYSNKEAQPDLLMWALLSKKYDFISSIYEVMKSCFKEVQSYDNLTIYIKLDKIFIGVFIVYQNSSYPNFEKNKYPIINNISVRNPSLEKHEEEIILEMFNMQDFNSVMAVAKNYFIEMFNTLREKMQIFAKGYYKAMEYSKLKETLPLIEETEPKVKAKKTKKSTKKQ